MASLSAWVRNDPVEELNNLPLPSCAPEVHPHVEEKQMFVKLLAILMWHLANCSKLLLLNLSGLGCIYIGQATKKDRRVKRQSERNSITVSTIHQYAVKLAWSFFLYIHFVFFSKRQSKSFCFCSYTLRTIFHTWKWNDDECTFKKQSVKSVERNSR